MNSVKLFGKRFSRRALEMPTKRVRIECCKVKTIRYQKKSKEKQIQSLINLDEAQDQLLGVQPQKPQACYFRERRSCKIKDIKSISQKKKSIQNICEHNTHVE